MNLIVDQMVELEVVRIADRDALIKRLAGASVVQNGLAVFREIVGTCGQYVGKEYHQYDQCGKYYIRTGHFKVFLLLFSGFHIPSKNFSCVIWPL